MKRLRDWQTDRLEGMDRLVHNLSRFIQWAQSTVQAGGQRDRQTDRQTGGLGTVTDRKAGRQARKQADQ